MSDPIARYPDCAKEGPKRPILVASNALINNNDEMLMGRRTDCGLWENPGGKIEAESVVEGARREMREESGIELLGTPVCLGYSDGWEWSGVAGKQWFVCIQLLWREWHGVPALLEGKHHEWKWFKLDDLPTLEQMTHGTRVFVTDMLTPYLHGLGRQPRKPARGGFIPATVGLHPILRPPGRWLRPSVSDDKTPGCKNDSYCPWCEDYHEVYSDYKEKGSPPAAEKLSAGH